MPYKKNPMKCERLCGFARTLQHLPGNALQTAGLAGFERTLDDSSNRRLVLPQAFLTLDALLTTAQNVVGDLRVIHKRREANVKAELPFLALEPVLMALTQKGKGRQEAHEKIREVALAAHTAKEEEGAEPSLEAMLSDPYFDSVRDDAAALAQPESMIGDCVYQVNEFMESELRPFLALYTDVKADAPKLTV